MERDDSKSVRLLETLPGPGFQQCLRLALCGAQLSEAMPGQYCLLANRSERWACNYVSLPGVDGRFMVATHSAHPLGQPGELLGYSGPLGSAWPVPLQSARLLAITRGEGVLALLCMLDEIHCWLPWVQVRLLHDGLPLEHLPTECRPIVGKKESHHSASGCALTICLGQTRWINVRWVGRFNATTGFRQRSSGFLHLAEFQ